MSEARNQRRALAKELSKEVVPQIGQREEEGPPREPPTLESLQAKIDQLEERNQQLADAFSQNTDVFAGGFEAVDKRMYTMMRVLSEMYFMPGKIHLKTERQVFKDEETGESYIHGGRTIDWMAYFGEFHAMLGLVALGETHCMNKPEELPDNVVVFGGNGDSE